MRVILFFAAVAAAAALVSSADLTAEQSQKLIEYHKECAVKTGVDSSLIEKAKQGSFNGDQKLKEQLLCVGKKLGFITEAGEVQKDVIVAKLGAAIKDEAVAKRLIDECAVKKNTPAETAYDSFVCYYEKTPNHIVIF